MTMRSVSPPDMVYSAHRSLYKSLNPDIVHKLEEALLLGRAFFAYPEALAVLDGVGAPEIFTPAFVIEKSQLLFVQGRHGDAAQVLRDALSHAANGGEDLQEPPYRLIRAMLGYTECFSEGTFTKGVESMHEIRAWLGNVAMEDYSDIQVRVAITNLTTFYRQVLIIWQVDCVQYYYSLALMAKLGMVFFDLSKYGDFPRFDDGDGIWTGITRLREHLQTNGRMVEAMNLLSKELLFIPTELKLMAIRSFLDQCEKYTVKGQPVWLVERAARLHLFEQLMELGRLEEARDELARVRNVSDLAIPERYCGIGRYSELIFDLKKAEMAMAGEYEAPNMYELWVSLADLAALLENFHQEDRALGKAVGIAEMLARQEPSTMWTQKYFSLCARLETRDRQLRRTFWLLFNYAFSVPQFVVIVKVGYGTTLEWIRAVKQDYPDYSFTRVLVAIEGGKYQIAVAMDSSTLMAEAVEAANQATAKEELFWQRYPPPRIQITQRDQTSSLHDTIGIPRATYKPFSLATASGLEGLLLEEISLDTIIPFSFYGQLDSLDSQSLPYEPFWRMLLKWMREDYAGSILTEESLRSIFPIAASGGIHGDGWSTFLDELRGNTLRETLLPKNGTARYFQQWGHILGSIIGWFSNSTKRPEALREFLICFLQRSRFIFTEPACANPDLIIEECQRFLHIVPHVDSPEVKEFFWSQTIAARQTISGVKVVKIETFKGAQDELRDLIEECVKERSMVARECQDAGQLEIGATEYVCSVSVRLDARLKGFNYPTDKMIQDLNVAESLFSSWRREFSTSHGLESILNQDIYSSSRRSQLRRIYDFALQTLWTEPESPERDATMWDFIQRAKARALVEFLGIGSLLADSAIKKGSLSAESIMLLREEKALLTSIQEKRPMERAEMRETHKVILSRMKSRDDLASILATREGTPFTVEDMRRISANVPNGRKIVYVDWFFLNNLDENTFPTSVWNQDEPQSLIPQIMMTTASAGEAPRAWKIELTIQNLQEWMKDDCLGNLTHPDANEWLADLDPLIAPLESASAPGDLLVLCPTKILHQIPIHALGIGDELLIKRNPVLYAHSLSLLRYCFSNYEQSDAISNKPWKADAFCRPRTEAGRSVVPELGRLLETEPAVDPDATKARFIHALRTTSLLHFHGHCKPDGATPLDHYLKLSNEERLTARELFDLFRPTTNSCYHVNLIACKSGAMHTSQHDNNLGLATAFLHCGATSSVSTLWSIWDEDAAVFEVVFGKAVEEARRKGGSGGGGVVDIAKVMQEASLVIMEKRRESPPPGKPQREPPPYHWAPFVGHGFWLIKTARVKREIAKEGVIPFSLFFVTGKTSLYALLKARFRGSVRKEEYTEQTPIAAPALHWAKSVVLVAVTAMLKPTTAYSALVALYSYVIINLVGLFVSGGLLYLMYFSPSTKWRRIANFRPWGSPVYAFIYFVVCGYLLFATFAKPSRGSPYSRENSNIEWYIIPAIGLSTLSWGFFWYLGLRLDLWLKREELKVHRVPVIVQDDEDPDQWVQECELIEHERRTLVSPYSDLETRGMGMDKTTLSVRHEQL